jgi:hypothetical protein
MHNGPHFVQKYKGVDRRDIKKIVAETENTWKKVTPLLKMSICCGQTGQRIPATPMTESGHHHVFLAHSAYYLKHLCHL